MYIHIYIHKHNTDDYKHNTDEYVLVSCFGLWSTVHTVRRISSLGYKYEFLHNWGPFTNMV